MANTGRQPGRWHLLSHTATMVLAVTGLVGGVSAGLALAAAVPSAGLGAATLVGGLLATTVVIALLAHQARSWRRAQDSVTPLFPRPRRRAHPVVRDRTASGPVRPPPPGTARLVAALVGLAGQGGPRRALGVADRQRQPVVQVGCQHHEALPRQAREDLDLEQPAHRRGRTRPGDLGEQAVGQLVGAFARARPVKRRVAQPAVVRQRGDVLAGDDEDPPPLAAPDEVALAGAAGLATSIEGRAARPASLRAPSHARRAGRATTVSRAGPGGP